jgi:hypothetical protein
LVAEGNERRAPQNTQQRKSLERRRDAETRRARNKKPDTHKMDNNEVFIASGLARLDAEWAGIRLERCARALC